MYEQELIEAINALPNKARKLIVQTINSDQTILAGRWVDFDHEGNLCGCLMMDGAPTETLSEIGLDNQAAALEFLADLYDLQDKLEHDPDYEYVLPPVTDAAKVFDMFAKENTGYAVMKGSPNIAWKESFLTHGVLTEKGREALKRDIVPFIVVEP